MIKKVQKRIKNDLKLFDKQYIKREQFLKQKKEMECLFKSMNQYEIVKEEQSEETASELSIERGHTLQSKQLYTSRINRDIEFDSQLFVEPFRDKSKSKFLNSVKSIDELRLPNIERFTEQKEVTGFEDEFSDMLSEIQGVDQFENSENLRKMNHYKQNKRSTLDIYINNPLRYKIKEDRKTAFDKYEQRCKELMILPVPLGLKYSDTQPKDIIANDYRMGKDYIDAITSALSVLPKTETLSLRNNKIEGEPAKKLLLHNTDNILTLDLSENSNIPFKTYEIIGQMLADGYKLLRVLHLENNKMGDNAMNELCNNMLDNNSLKLLNVSGNLLTHKSMKSASLMLKKATLTSLFLRWNTIDAFG